MPSSAQQKKAPVVLRACSAPPWCPSRRNALLSAERPFQEQLSAWISRHGPQEMVQERSLRKGAKERPFPLLALGLFSQPFRCGAKCWSRLINWWEKIQYCV